MEEDNFEREFDKYRLINDRFAFDDLFRFLLRSGLSHDECKEAILANCSLSVLVFQERIHNRYYLRISEDERLSDDLRVLRDELFAKSRPRGTFN